MKHYTSFRIGAPSTIPSRYPLVIFLALLGTCSVITAMGQGGPKVGERAPLLQAKTLWQAPPNARLDADSAKGKVVVLEFWATWCGPCVQAIPHLNELANKFRNKPVQFIAITSEDEATIKAFLKKKPINAWLVLDTEKAMYNAYGVGPIPHTVLIGKDGKIAGITSPFELKEELLNELLSGKEVNVRRVATQDIGRFGALPADAQWGLNELTVGKGSELPLFQVLVRRASDTSAQYGFGGKGRGFALAGSTIRDILPRAFGQPLSRILIQTPLPEGKFDFVVNPGRDSQTDPAVLLQQALKSAFGLSGRKISQETNVFTLKVSNPKAPGLVAATTENFSMRSAVGEFSGVDLSMSDLARALERILNAAVVDETGLTGRFDIDLKWPHYPPESSTSELKKALRDQLGLNLEAAKRSIEIWVVEGKRNTDIPANEPAAQTHWR